MELKLDLGALIQSQVSERLNINLTLLPLQSMKKLLLRAAEIDLGLQQRLWYFKYLNVCNICNSLPQGHWSALLWTLVPQHWVRACPGAQGSFAVAVSDTPRAEHPQNSAWPKPPLTPAKSLWVLCPRSAGWAERDYSKAGLIAFSPLLWLCKWKFRVATWVHSNSLGFYIEWTSVRIINI